MQKKQVIRTYYSWVSKHTQKCDCSMEFSTVHYQDVMLALIVHWNHFVIMLNMHTCLVFLFHVPWMVRNSQPSTNSTFEHFFSYKAVNHQISLTGPILCLITFLQSMQNWMVQWFSCFQMLCDPHGTHFHHPFHLPLNFLLQEDCIRDV